MTTGNVTRKLLAATAALAALGAVGATTACEQIQRAVDCAQLALEVADSSTDLQNAVQTDGLQDDDAALDEMTTDINELTDEVADTDVQQAAQDVLSAGESVRQAAEDGTVPDLSPLLDATDELTQVCSAGGGEDGGEG